MSVAKEVLKWAKQNVAHSGSGNDILVPGVSYPHMHITNSYVGYSTTSKHRRPLVDGDTIHAGTVKDVAATVTGDAKRVAVYIRDTW